MIFLKKGKIPEKKYSQSMSQGQTSEGFSQTEQVVLLANILAQTCGMLIGTAGIQKWYLHECDYKKNSVRYSVYCIHWSATAVQSDRLFPLPIEEAVKAAGCIQTLPVPHHNGKLSILRLKLF